MKYLICFVTEGGHIHTVSDDHDLERAKRTADTLQRRAQDKIKVLHVTPHGYRVHYIAKR